MPISEDDIIQNLFKLLAEERAERVALTELLLKQCNALPRSTDETASCIPPTLKLVGKKPWHMLQADLTDRFKKKKVTVEELTGIVEDTDNAG